LLTLFVYFNTRNGEQDSEEWFGKKSKLIVILTAPFLMVLLLLINNLRFGLVMDDSNFFSFIVSFIYNQGVSINVIKRAELFKNVLPSGKWYSFGELIAFFQSNIISRLMGIRYYSGNNIEHALYGSSMGHALSYVVLKKEYLSGAGLGSCYIAEVYHDFNYLGVIIINTIYGTLLKWISDLENRNIWLTAVLFLVFNSLLLAPRGSADLFLTCMIDMTTWGTIAIIWIVSKLLIHNNQINNLK